MQYSSDHCGMNENGSSGLRVMYGDLREMMYGGATRPQEPVTTHDAPHQTPETDTDTDTDTRQQI
jgi:hypothetical protein